MSKMSRSHLRSLRLYRRFGMESLRRIVLPLALGIFASLPFAATAQPTSSQTAVGEQIKASAVAQMSVLNQIKTSKTPTQNKIDSRLFLALLKQKGDSRMASLPKFRFVQPEKDGRLPVDVIIRKPDDVAAVWTRLRDMEAVIATDKRIVFDSRTVRARVKMSDLEPLAAMTEILKVRQALPAFTNVDRAGASPGPVKAASGSGRLARTLSEGVRTHGADTAQDTYGARGAGQTICALSDGAESIAASQQSGDLPLGDQVFVLPGQVGTGNEGTAMMEIIHDVAPAARIGFATAIRSEVSFAQNILDLAAAGCTIIVDDVLYLDESPFQDGPVAQAVNTVTGNGVLYFSSAGNEGNLTDRTSGTWEGSFLANGTLPSLPDAGPVHNFGDGGQSIATLAGGVDTPVVLIWAEHYDLNVGNASTDYDLYNLSNDLANVEDASTDTQDGVGGDDFPIEFLSQAFGGTRLVVSRPTAGTTSSAPAFNLIYFRGLLDQSLATAGATRGHSAASRAFSVAATPAAGAFGADEPSGPFPNLFTGANVSETFSSDGRRRILLSPSGDELTPGNRTITGGVLRQKPDLTAADGVSTSAPGFSTFYGTSAAAPHAAAIAGIVRSALPSLTVRETRDLLTSTAIDIETPGRDRSTGFGIVMPVPALQAGGAIGRAFLVTGTPVYTQVTGDGDAFIEPYETWSVSVPLTNTGVADSGPVSVTFSTNSPNVSVRSSTANYPNIAPGATVSSDTPFAFRVQRNFACGGVIRFAESASYAGSNSPQIFTFSTDRTGAPVPVTFSYAGPPVRILDRRPPVDIPLQVTGVPGQVTDVNLSIDGTSCTTHRGATTVGIDHEFDGDLDISVVSPSGTAVLAIDNAGSFGRNFCQTVLDDESTGINIEDAPSSAAPFTGSFLPANRLSRFDGEPANGTWALRVRDGFPQDHGSVRAFSLTVTGASCDAAPTSGP